VKTLPSSVSTKAPPVLSLGYGDLLWLPHGAIFTRTTKMMLFDAATGEIRASPGALLEPRLSTNPITVVPVEGDDSHVAPAELLSDDKGA
jgi:hypothetical protein